MITEVVFDATDSVVIAKTAEDYPAGTVTLVGTVATVVTVLTNVTTAPPVGAGPFKVTVPLDVDVPNTVDGSRVTEYAAAEAATVSGAVFEAPALVAVIVVDAPVVTGSDVIGNVAMVVPAATLTLAGTVARVVTELVSVTAVPPTGATAFRVTVPVPPKPPMTLVWLNVSVASNGVTVRVAVF